MSLRDKNISVTKAGFEPLFDSIVNQGGKRCARSQYFEALYEADSEDRSVIRNHVLPGKEGQCLASEPDEWLLFFLRQRNPLYVFPVFCCPSSSPALCPTTSSETLQEIIKNEFIMKTHSDP
jgi:hypothetical protein